jgi:hypothetical protein
MEKAAFGKTAFTLGYKNFRRENYLLTWNAFI